MERAAIELLVHDRPHLQDDPERLARVERAVDAIDDQLLVKARDTVRRRDYGLHEALHPPAVLREVCELQRMVALAVDTTIDTLGAPEASSV